MFKFKRKVAYWLRQVAQHLDKEPVTLEQIGLEDVRIDDVMVLIFRGADLAKPISGYTEASPGTAICQYKVIKE